MPTEHLSWQIEAYLDQQLPAADRERVEAHLATCAACSRSLADAQRLAAELKPTLQQALGRPAPPPDLRARVRQGLRLRSGRSFWWGRATPAQLLGALGTTLVIALLAVGVMAVIRSRQAGVPLSPRPAGTGAAAAVLTPSPTPALTPAPTTALTPGATGSPQGDLAQTPPAGATPAGGESAPPPDPTSGSGPTPAPAAPETPARPTPAQPGASPSLPGGTIAFSFFNPAPHRRVYEIHLISPDGDDHRIFPVDGVSEPALAPAGDRLAFRAWSEPTGPRSLLSSDLDGVNRSVVGGFFEDARPRWSADGERLIYASQREVDRRWRLYLSRADGSDEVDLRLEGRAPAFAPDGQRFAYEGCDASGNRCGLWLAEFVPGETEVTTTLLLEDARAAAPAWSPTGGQIAYMANPGGNWDLFLVDSDGGPARRLTTGAAVDGLPAWSPNGEWLAFLSDRDGEWGIWLLHVASGQVRRVFAFDGGVFTPPARDPYGQRNWWDEQLSWSR